MIERVVQSRFARGRVVRPAPHGKTWTCHRLSPLWGGRTPARSTGDVAFPVRLTGVRFEQRKPVARRWCGEDGLFPAPASRSRTYAGESLVHASESFIPASNSLRPASDSLGPAINSFAHASESFGPAINSFAPANDSFAPAINSLGHANDSFAAASGVLGRCCRLICQAAPCVRAHTRFE